MAAALSVSVMAASCSKEDTGLQSQNTEMSAQKSVQDQYIVTLSENAMSAGQIQAEAAKIFSDLGIEGTRFTEGDILAHIASGFIANLNPAEAAKLGADSRVKSVEQDAVVKGATADATPSDGTRVQTLSWGLSLIGGAGNGTGKTAWIIDSGIDYNHPDLNVDKTRSRSFLTSSAGGNWSSPSDELGHGTQVAGIIGAKNNSEGAVGVAAGANLVSLRIMNYQGSCWSSGLIKALNHVYYYGKAGDVVNLSVIFAANSTIDYYVRKVASKGIYVAMAAGNNNGDAIYKSPARLNTANVYTVSAMTSNGARWSNSNYGSSTVDYAAPASGIYTTTKGGGYGTTGSGTSWAAPHVAGILLVNGGKINNGGYVTGDPDGKADPIAKR